jgi:hypothetical protein
VEKLVAPITDPVDPVLTVWEAMNLLDNVDLQSATPEISNILVEAERILFSLVTALVRRTKETERIFSEGRVIAR